MPTVVTVIGTRPEAIKMAPLIRRLESTPNLSVVVCSTGQHREMIKQVFDLFSIQPDVDLAVMRPDQKLSELTANVVTGMESIIAKYRPDRVLVHGDTTTTMATALAAYYQKVPVGHVEAGLRTGNIYAPWPEEINRRIADTICDRLYAPTTSARDNLVAELPPPQDCHGLKWSAHKGGRRSYRRCAGLFLQAMAHKCSRSAGLLRRGRPELFDSRRREQWPSWLWYRHGPTRGPADVSRQWLPFR